MGEAFMVSELGQAALRALNHTPEVDRLRRLPNVPRLGQLVAKIGGSFGAVFTRIDCERSEGVPLYSQLDTFGAEPQGRIIRRDAMPRPEEQTVHKWQILIAGAGQMAEGNLFGRSIIADNRLVDGYCGPDSMALTFPEPGGDLNLWVYAFLNSRIGLRAVRSAAYGTSIPRLRTDLLKDIPIPPPDDTIARRVASLVRRCVEQRELHARELAAARNLIEALPAMREAHEMSAARKRRAVLWSGPLRSMRAWNYASTGGAAEHLSRAWTARIGDIVSEANVFRGNRYNRVDCEAPHGVEMLSQRDAFLIRPIPRRIVRPPAADRDLFVRPGSIVIAGAGTLGEGEIFCRAMYVSRLFEGRACTELLLRMAAEPQFSEPLYAFLTTPVGFRLLRSTVFGTKLAYPHPSWIRDLPLPPLSAD